MGAERERVRRFGRLEDGLREAGHWYRWGPYVSERQWGTVHFLAREGFADRRALAQAGRLRGDAGSERLLLSVAGPGRLERLMSRLFDEGEFLSPHGLPG